MAKKDSFNMLKPINHIAFIMDGNGRWAKKKNKPRTYGHKVAINNLMKIIEECNKLRIKGISLFAFSTENWKRDKKEINMLFHYLEEFLNKKEKVFIKNNIKFIVSGDYKKLPISCVSVINRVKKSTKNNTGLKLNVCLNYGGMQEIIYAINKIIKSKVKKIDLDSFYSYLYCYNELGPIDLMIRTSGEVRISNFMLSYLAYSELIFTPTYFPDFNVESLHNCLSEYFSRDRRFGAINEKN